MSRRAPAADVARSTTAPLLEVADLCVRIPGAEGGTALLDDVSFTMKSGMTLGLVGESGSGKSITAKSILRLLPRPLEISRGSVRLDGIDLLTMPDGDLRRVRGKDVGFIFQDPHNSFDPSFTVGRQMVETIRAHTDLSAKEARDRAIGLLDRVGIQRARQRADDYPHQLSGGMAQRAMTAMAISCDPRLLIADEPTTALDVTVQRQILSLLRSLQGEMGMAILLVSHDLSVISEMADDMVVLYAGRVVEHGGVVSTFQEPHHPYTEALLGARPGATTKGQRLLAIPGNVPAAHEMPTGCRFHTRCQYAVEACKEIEPELTTIGAGEARCLRAHDLALRGADPALAPVPVTAPVRLTKQATPSELGGEVLLDVRNLRKEYRLHGSGVFGGREVNTAVDDVSFILRPGESLGIVGESGAGKSTVGRLVLGLDEPTAGSIVIGGQSFSSVRGRKRRAMRRNIQAVFQNPQAALDPTMTIGDSVAEPLQIHLELSKGEERLRVEKLLSQVGLDPSLVNRYPHTLSGGQRQRVVIARALALSPSLIICDEPVSALDVSTQAQVVNLLVDLQRELGMAYLFVGHDLSIVYQVSDRIAVMYAGRIVEIGDAEAIYFHPQHPYTKLLLSAVLSLDPTRRRLDETPPPEPAATGESSGCSFARRCPSATDVCRTTAPEHRTAPSGAEVACHLYPAGVTVGEPQGPQTQSTPPNGGREVRADASPSLRGVTERVPVNGASARPLQMPGRVARSIKGDQP